MELDDQTSSSLIQNVSLGILKPGESLSKTLSLISKGGAGDRTLDISVQTRPSSEPAEDEDDEHDGEQPEPDDHTTEIVRTITIPVVDPLKASIDVVYARMPGKQTGPSDLRLYEGRHWADADGTEATIMTQIEFAGPWSLDVQSIKLVIEVRLSLFSYTSLLGGNAPY